MQFAWHKLRWFSEQYSLDIFEVIYHFFLNTVVEVNGALNAT